MPLKNVSPRNKVAFDSFSVIDDYLSRLDWKINENSNLGYSLQGLNNHIMSQAIEHYWLTKLYDEDISAAHKNGEFHLHDLNYLGAYCCGWDLYDLLCQGFCGARGKTESNPPKHFSPALGQIVNFFYTLQGESAGAQAFSNFDTLLAPFIRYDKLSYHEVKQHMQEFVFNMNTPTRVGFQTPFTNITMDLTPSSAFAKMPVIIGGKPQKETYGEFQAEMDLLNRAFCEVMLEGDRKGMVFTFPIPTYNITKDFNWDAPELGILWEMTAKYGIPYFANFINADMNPEDVRSMCCRLRLDNRELRKRGGGLFGANPLTGSIGVVTINLPRAAHTAQGNSELFFAHIDRLVALARKSLLVKREIIEKFTNAGLYPYARHYLQKVKHARGSYWANHFNTIGVIGMHEACMNLIGQPIQSDQGAALAHKTLTHIREKLSAYQEEDDTLYNLEATPGEGTTCRLARLDKACFPTAYFSGKNVPFYTNSTHMPVDFTHDIFDALKHQDDLQTLYTGGTVFHGFIGERIDNPDMVKRLIKKIFCTFKLPYITISPTFSICPEHGYIAGEHHRCPYHEATEPITNIKPTERSPYETGNQRTKQQQTSI